jgi:FkbM family methyltransferase
MAHMTTRLEGHRRLIRALGYWGWLTFQASKRSPLIASLLGYRAWAKGLSGPVFYRPRESDRDVFSTIFIEREYSCLDAEDIRGLILDCGANVGYSSAYLLERFPASHVVAVEPDAENFRMLQKNLARFAGRVVCVNGGVWSKKADLVVSHGAYRDGRAWAVQVREAREDETASISAFAIADLLEIAGDDRIALLKMDIERSEIEVFRNGDMSWLDRCERIVIELHDDECERAFHEAIRGHGFRVSRCGELTVCLRSFHG